MTFTVPGELTGGSTTLYYVMNSTIELSPFGFTPTESHVYGNLLAGGPASGYSIAKRLHMARANAYQALDGLVSKGAAEVFGERPKRYRATRPEAILAQIIDRQSRLLDRLETQVSESPSADTEDIIRIEGQRAIVDLAMRTATRHEGSVESMGPAEFLSLLTPVWRLRESKQQETHLWVVGSGEVAAPGVSGHVAEEEVDRLYGSAVFILTAGDSILTAQLRETGSRGVWSCEPTVVGSVRGAIDSLTGSRGLSARLRT